MMERVLADFCAEVSLVDWWPVRILVILLTLVAAGLLVWRFRKRTGRMVLLTMVVVLLGVNALVTVNAYFGYYLTLGQALGLAGEDQGSLAALNAQKARPANGVVVAITIPGRQSGFAARPAQVYLPPVWFTHPRPKLPVVVLLHGTPGSPADWLDGGGAQVTADRWASAHNGAAPIIVMPDINGSVIADTECVDGPRGNAETYLSSDVPRFVRSRFVTRDPGRDWAVAGLSEGGSCATMLALRHPTLYGTFANYGGLLGPRSGADNDLGDTVQTVFGGSRNAFAAHEPAQLLAHGRFPGMHGFYAVGGSDPDPLEAQHTLEGLSRRAGIDTRSAIIPGGQHTFDVWRSAFALSLPWLAEQLNTEPPRPPAGRTNH